MRLHQAGGASFPEWEIIAIAVGVLAGEIDRYDAAERIVEALIRFIGGLKLSRRRDTVNSFAQARYGIWDLGFGIWDLGFGISDFGFRISDFGLGFGIWDFGFRISDLGFGI